MNRHKGQSENGRSLKKKNTSHLAKNEDSFFAKASYPSSFRPFTSTTTTIAFNGGVQTNHRSSGNNLSSSSRSTRLPVVPLSSRSVASHSDVNKYSSVNNTQGTKNKTPTTVVPRKFTITAALMNRNSHPSDAIVTENYTIRPVVPAKKKELIAVAKAMHRESFAPRVKALFQPETDAAMDAISSGIYIGFRCPEFKYDCIRLGGNSRCFCDHPLCEHEPYNKKKVRLKCKVTGCTCRAYQFIPQRPEDVGEWWHQRRPGFNVTAWRAKCRCKHSHVGHNPVSGKCVSRGCGCFRFTSNFLCAACDRHWEEHETFFDDLISRKQKGLPYGEEYIPFHELPELKHMCLTGSGISSSFNVVSKR